MRNQNRQEVSASRSSARNLAKGAGSVLNISGRSVKDAAVKRVISNSDAGNIGNDWRAVGNTLRGVSIR